MANINLYKIEQSKKETCIEKLEASYLKQKGTIESTIDGHDFTFTLFLEEPHQSDDDISWNWLLEEFEEDSFYAYKAPKAVLIIKHLDADNTYAVTFGNSYFMIDKYCDRDFGFDFASRMEYTNVKTTTLTAPNSARNKTVNTYINYNNLDFNSGESFAKLKVNIKLNDNFTLFKPSVEIGNSIKFNIEDNNTASIAKLILYVENILKIPDDQIKYRIPLFQQVKDDERIKQLNDNLDEELERAILGEDSNTSIVIPELEIIGANEIFNHVDDEYTIKYRKNEIKVMKNLGFKDILKFCLENSINTIEEFERIKVSRYKDGEQVKSSSIKDIIEYTDEKLKCIFDKGKWYSFNKDYLTYLDDSIRQINTYYRKEYDMSDKDLEQFIEEKYLQEKDNSKYKGKSEIEVKDGLRKKYYYEFCFNTLKARSGIFDNYDRKGTSDGFEMMDLYEKDSQTMFAVKKGKASSNFCYAIDQSLTSLKKYMHGEATDMPPIKRVGLWLILERKNHLNMESYTKVDLTSLDMLMLKNRIDQWDKEVRNCRLEPVIYINYRD